MRKSIVLLLSIFLFVAVSLGSAVEFKFSTAKLSEPTLCTGVDEQTKKPHDKTSIFGPDTKEIFCSVKLSNAPQTKITGQWIYVKGELKEYTNHMIAETSLTADGTRYLSFSLEKPTNGFPKGEYVLKLFLDEEEKMSVSFKVI
ncbi:hypothetical protein ACFL1T_04150 [Chlamydiota bacterium]